MQAAERIKDETALKPDITGRLRKSEPKESPANENVVEQESVGVAAEKSESGEAPRLHWNPPADDPIFEIVLPVKVKKD